LLRRQRAKVGPFFIGVAEGIGNRRSGDIEHGPSHGVEHKLGDAIEHNMVGYGLEGGGGYGVAEHVVRPSQYRGRCHSDVVRNQSKVTAFARP
jgi:hypothetical protein